MWSDLERGPLEPLAADALRPVPAAASFEGLVARALDGRGAADATLAATARTTVEAPPDDLDGAFVTTIGAAAQTADDESAASGVSPAGALVVAGDSTDAIRISVARYLPPPETPISASFEEPPLPPGGDLEGGDVGPRPGRGVDDTPGIGDPREPRGGGGTSGGSGGPAPAPTPGAPAPTTEPEPPPAPAPEPEPVAETPSPTGGGGGGGGGDRHGDGGLKA